MDILLMRGNLGQIVRKNMKCFVWGKDSNTLLDSRVRYDEWNFKLHSIFIKIIFQLISALSVSHFQDPLLGLWISIPRPINHRQRINYCKKRLDWQLRLQLSVISVPYLRVHFGGQPHQIFQNTQLEFITNINDRPATDFCRSDICSNCPYLWNIFIFAFYLLWFLMKSRLLIFPTLWGDF